MNLASKTLKIRSRRVACVVPHHVQRAHAASYVSSEVLESGSSEYDGVNDDVLLSRKLQTSPGMPNLLATGTVGLWH